MVTPCCRCRRTATQILVVEVPGQTDGLLYALVCCRHQREVARLLMTHDHPVLLLPRSALSDLHTLSMTDLWELQSRSSKSAE